MKKTGLFLLTSGAALMLVSLLFNAMSISFLGLGAYVGALVSLSGLFVLSARKRDAFNFRF